MNRLNLRGDVQAIYIVIRGHGDTADQSRDGSGTLVCCELACYGVSDEAVWLDNVRIGWVFTVGQDELLWVSIGQERLQNVLLYQVTHQTDENAYQLNHVGVSHGIETPEERVENSDAGREDDGYGLVQIKDDTEGCAWK